MTTESGAKAEPTHPLPAQLQLVQSGPNVSVGVRKEADGAVTLYLSLYSPNGSDDPEQVTGSAVSSLSVWLTPEEAKRLADLLLANA